MFQVSTSLQTGGTNLMKSQAYAPSQRVVRRRARVRLAAWREQEGGGARGRGRERFLASLVRRNIWRRRKST